MNPRWKDRAAALVSCALAVWLGFQVADGNWTWPLLAAGVAAAAIGFSLLRLPLDVIVMGLLLVGYIVGNRGFAQLMLSPALPILPGEIGLAAVGGWLAVRCAFEKNLPWRPTPLNYAVLAFLVIGTTRFLFDVREFGILAIRDFATVYYAGFFFVAQHLGRNPAHRDFLISCLVGAGVGLPVMYILFELAPDFFLGTLTLHGVPLVLYKGDLAPTFMGVGAILLLVVSRGRRRWWAYPLATAMILWVFAGENRASALGTAVALGWLAISRFRHLAAAQAAVAVLLLIIVAALAGPGENEWARGRLHGITDRVASVFDFSGRQAYRADVGLSKSDNNQFRWVWWRAVVSETTAESPVFGLGFGYDLARGFLQEYYPDPSEEFTARSPHNIALTIFGRTGVAGLASFLVILACILTATWRAMRTSGSPPEDVALWALLWPLLVSACLGVVLEGPMGAMVFWTTLGLAHIAPANPATPPASAETVADHRSVPHHPPLGQQTEPPVAASARLRP